MCKTCFNYGFRSSTVFFIYTQLFNTFYHFIFCESIRRTILAVIDRMDKRLPVH